MHAMFDLFQVTLGAIKRLFCPASPLLENLVLRQQLVVLMRKSKRSQLRAFDRLFWITIKNCGETGKTVFSSSLRLQLSAGTVAFGLLYCFVIIGHTILAVPQFVHAQAASISYFVQALQPYNPEARSR
jgi:hypothetical protein